VKPILDTAITYLPKVGPKRAELLEKELGVRTFRDLLWQLPYRYVDRTVFHKIGDLQEAGAEVQLRGVLRRVEVSGRGRSRRLTAVLRDSTGSLELVWFRGIDWFADRLMTGREYIVFGRLQRFNNRWSIPHPDIEAVQRNAKPAATLEPVYSSTEKLNQAGVEQKLRRKMMQALLDKLSPEDLPDNLPSYLLEKLKLPSRFLAFRQIHFPASAKELHLAQARFKFEELFFHQLRLLQIKRIRIAKNRGFVFEKVGDYFNRFYRENLPFELTGAQKRVMKEIRRDLGSGRQMNRLLQGDVGSGKTVVALMSMLLAVDNGFQAALMAPTEILAQQHYQSLSKYLQGLGIRMAFLSGSVKGRQRKQILAALAAGDLHFIVGTHALLEESVQFQNLGLAVIDEQHRFGVAQRARLWKKNPRGLPHVLVMTATPIPRTLAMTLYGDLDTSVIDELPPGRKPIKTILWTEHHRLRLFGFLKREIKRGRQVYVVYPLIEKSEKLDLLNLEQGVEAMSREFPAPEYAIAVVHGRMKPADKEREMQRFAKGEADILVATTVIEVGVDVPNASVMVIENAERFGLSQLHQLRGRVGRGAEQSFCILMAGNKLGNDSKKRLQTMVASQDGFKIAEVDLELRGPGDIEGTRQSGLLDFRIANIATDQHILQTARQIAIKILEADPDLQKPEHAVLKSYLDSMAMKVRGWAQIS